MSKFLTLPGEIWRHRKDILEFVFIVATAFADGIGKRIRKRKGLRQDKTTITPARGSSTSRPRPKPIPRTAITDSTKERIDLLARLRSHRPSRAVLVGGAVLVLLGSVIGTWLLTGPRVVLANGTPIAVAGSRAEYQGALQKVLAAKSSQSAGMTVEVIDQVKLQYCLNSGACSEDELMQILSSQLNFNTVATAIVVNGQSRVLLASPEAANSVLERLKATYVSQYPPEGMKSVGFAEEVSLEQVVATPADILAPDKAIEMILDGEQKPEARYKIKEGDNPWTIARSHDLNVDDLMAANPGIDEERLMIGQEIKLTKSTPFITVVAKVGKQFRQEVPFEVEVRPDDGQPSTYQKVLEPGAVGMKDMDIDVVYLNGVPSEELVLSEVMVQEPVKQVEIRGTRAVTASRKEETASSRLSWPLRGTITSPYGKRGRGFHTGLDIGAGYGRPITAAGPGTVIEAGWGGAYGREIVINHGGGLMTRYAHCSSLKVRSGAKVARGEVIGYVGSSGRSTGPHLHFEVIVNGSTVNPTRYLP
ncbi:MAG: peptidoglycan DD-metalloendopeptidase family protein [Firmicutes bacterium]|nr:peptidoglycan DD-metalloendopeptidase family protein [Bacillota bacterium]